MKKITMIIMFILVAALLTASVAQPPPKERITGVVRYSRHSVCVFPDFIALPVMENVYLIGDIFPSKGEYQGCIVNGMGSQVTVGSCKYFIVDTCCIVCPTSDATHGKR